jgi:hypothetical protein
MATSKVTFDIVINGVEVCNRLSAMIVSLRTLQEEIRGFDNGRGEGEYFAREIGEILEQHAPQEDEK